MSLTPGLNQKELYLTCLNPDVILISLVIIFILLIIFIHVTIYLFTCVIVLFNCLVSGCLCSCIAFLLSISIVEL